MLHPVDKCYRWFDILSKQLKDSIVQKLIHPDIKKCARIDATNYQIMMRKKILLEILNWISNINVNEYFAHTTLFSYIN